ncbi:MAG: DUF6290 family protein [Elusimicrobiota bacterium]
MPKVITIRLADKEYEAISTAAEAEHRPISNFITARVLEDIEASCNVDSIEMAQIKSDKKLMGKLKSGHLDAKKQNGKFVG